MTFYVRQIPSHLTDRFWEFAEPYLKRALDHTSGEYAPSDIKQFCKDRIVQLWLVSENERVVAAITTELVTYPKRKHLRVLTLAGSKAPEWTELADTILSDFARAEQCHAIEAFVRKGYVPVLARYGFKHKYSAIVKDIV